jgi:hypothetical protein
MTVNPMVQAIGSNEAYPVFACDQRYRGNRGEHSRRLRGLDPQHGELSVPGPRSRTSVGARVPRTVSRSFLGTSDMMATTTLTLTNISVDLGKHVGHGPLASREARHCIRGFPNQTFTDLKGLDLVLNKPLAQ